MPKRRKNPPPQQPAEAPTYLRCEDCQTNDVGPEEAAAAPREGQTPHCRHLLPAHRMDGGDDNRRRRRGDGSLYQRLLNLDLLWAYRFVVLWIQLSVFFIR